MNCECIYYRKGATREDLMRLAKFVQHGSEAIERYPAALSVITEDTKCAPDYDGFGRKVTIPAGSEVLFVQGKLHYMVDIYADNNKHKFRALFPIERDIKFEDIITEFEEETK